jgi:plasmid stabilization system protein ParE
MLPVFWTEAADEDLAAITHYVAGYDPVAALRLWQRLKSAAVNLSEYPLSVQRKRTDARLPGNRRPPQLPRVLPGAG